MNRRRFQCLFHLLIVMVSLNACAQAISDQLPEVFLFDAIAPPRYAVGGTIENLIGGTPGITLQAGSGSVTVSGSGSPGDYTFRIPHGFRTDDHFTVKVSSYPANAGVPQICSSSNPTGTIDNSNINDIVFTCEDGRYINASVANLLGNQLQIRRTESPSGKSETMTFLKAENGSTKAFPMPATLSHSSSFFIDQQPQSPYQICVIDQPGPTMIAADLTVNITCTTLKFDLLATISSLSGAGLQLNVSGTPVSVTPGTSNITLAAALDSGTNFSVTIAQQPVGQSCTLAGATGTIGNANHTVSVACTTFGYSIGGSIAGLQGTGLQMRLINTDTATTVSTISPASGSTSYFFPVSLSHGTNYRVEVAANPASPTQQCLIGTASYLNGGPITGPVNSVNITCTTQTVPVSGGITGYTGQTGGLKLRDSISDTTITATAGDTSFTFQITSGQNFSLEVTDQPYGQHCSLVADATGNAGNGVTTTTLACTDLQVQLTTIAGSGAVFGGSVTVRLSGHTYLDGSTTATNDWTFDIAAPGTTTLSTPPRFLTGKTYTTAITQNLSGLLCQLSPGSFTMGATNYTGLSLSCLIDPPAPINGLKPSGHYLEADSMTLNGSTDTVVSVAPGALIDFVIDFHYNASCNNNCPVPVLVGIYGTTFANAGSRTCGQFSDGAPHPRYHTFSGNLTAPSTPGTYILHIWHTWDTCAYLEAWFTTQGEPIAIIKVVN